MATPREYFALMRVIPQGSILRSTLLLISISDLLDISSRPVIYAYDATIYFYLTSDFDRFNKVKFSAHLEKDLQFVN